MGELIEGLSLSPVNVVENKLGDIYKILSKSENSFDEFGEVYISTVAQGVVKAWKNHKQMICNLVVPFGEVKFVVFDDRASSKTKNKFFEITLSKKNYKRLTIPVKLWFGFKGLSKFNAIVNVASVPHDHDECDRKELDQIKYDW